MKDSQKIGEIKRESGQEERVPLEIETVDAKEKSEELLGVKKQNGEEHEEKRSLNELELSPKSGETTEATASEVGELTVNDIGGISRAISEANRRTSAIMIGTRSNETHFEMKEEGFSKRKVQMKEGGQKEKEKREETKKEANEPKEAKENNQNSEAAEKKQNKDRKASTFLLPSLVRKISRTKLPFVRRLEPPQKEEVDDLVESICAQEHKKKPNLNQIYEKFSRMERNSTETENLFENCKFKTPIFIQKFKNMAFKWAKRPKKISYHDSSLFLSVVSRLLTHVEILEIKIPLGTFPFFSSSRAHIYLF